MQCCLDQQRTRPTRIFCCLHQPCQKDVNLILLFTWCTYFHLISIKSMPRIAARQNSWFDAMVVSVNCTQNSVSYSICQLVSFPTPARIASSIWKRSALGHGVVWVNFPHFVLPAPSRTNLCKLAPATENQVGMAKRLPLHQLLAGDARK